MKPETRSQKSEVRSWTSGLLRLAFILASLLLCIFALNVSAQTILDAPGLDAFKKKTSAGAGGPNTWFDTTTNTPNGTLNSSGPSFMEWGVVTVTTGGTANTLRANIHSATAPSAIKMALYDSSLHLIVSGTGSVANTISDSYATVTISNTSISSGTYYVAFASAVTGVFLNTKSGANGPYKSQAYSSFPPSTLPTEDGHVNQYLMGVFVQ